MSLDPFFQWLESTMLATAIRENALLFPLIESVHVLMFTVVFGTIAIVDLRLLGISSRDRRVSALSADILPITWAAFALAVLTGTMLFSSNATKYSHNIYFESKMALLGLAGINMLIFHLVGSRNLANWDDAAHTPWQAKVAGGCSMLIWIGVIVCGRWIGFTMMSTFNF